MKKVAIIMGSDSDLPIVKKGIDTLKAFNVPYEVHVFSAHRTPEEASNFTLNARANGFGAIICAAGMAAHLAGAIAARTTLPVIGIPVATVAINGATNAALLAIQMLAIENSDLAKMLDDKRISDTNAVLLKNNQIEKEYNN